MQIELTLNGTPTTVEVDKSDLLLDVLRRNGYTGAKRGCDTGTCGMCMVQVDGDAIQSCVTPATRVDGADVETIEGLGTQDDLHPIQQAFVDHSALQCGFCIPGFLMSAKDLLERNPEPSEQEVRVALDENLCRCTGYKKIVEAVLDAADRMAAEGEVAADGGAPVDDATPDGDATPYNDATPSDDATPGDQATPSEEAAAGDDATPDNDVSLDDNSGCAPFDDSGCGCCGGDPS